MAYFQRHHRWRTLVAIIAAVVIFAGLFVSRIAGYVFQTRVARAIEAKTHARVEFGTVLYEPPYSFYAHDVHVVMPRTEGGEIQKFAAGSISIRLNHFPWPGKPVAIDSLVARRAMINIEDRAEPLALDHLELSVRESGDKGIYQGRVTAGDSMVGSLTADGQLDLGAKQVRLEKITGAVRIAPLLTRLPLSQRLRPATDMAAPDGKIALDGWAIIPLQNLDHADYRLTVDLEGASAKVPQLKASLSDGRGRIVLRPSGISPSSIEASLESLHVASNKGSLELDGALATIRTREGTWDLAHVLGTMHVGNELPLFLPNSGWFFNEGQFNGPLRFTLAASGPFKLSGKDPFQAIRHEVLAYPRDFSLRPKNFLVPIKQINGGPVAFRGGVVSFQNLTGNYGKDTLLLRNGRLVLDDPSRKIAIGDLRSQVKFEEISGTVIFDRSSPPYPGVVGKAVAQLQPSGAFVVGGGSWYAINRPPRNEPWVKFKPDFYIRLAGDGGEFSMRPYNLPLTEIQGEAIFAPMSVEITGFRAKSLEGLAWADGQIVPGKPFLYQGKVDARDINLSELARLFPASHSLKRRITGTGGVSMHVAGAGKGGPKSPTEQLIADGEWEILHADFWSVPPVQDVANRVRKTDELGTGDAAGMVHVENNKVTLENSAINSPLLGLQGHGTIGFDKSLDLTVVAAPLGDWRDKMRQAGVPLVGDLLGALEQFLNAAKGTLFYQFKITGSVSHPTEALIPAPVITQPMIHLFGQMMRQDEHEKLLNDVKRETQAGVASADESSAHAQPASAQQHPGK